MTEKKTSADIQAFLNEPRLTIAEYERLRQALPGCSRTISLIDRLPEIARHEALLRTRGLDVHKLIAILTSSPADPMTLDISGISIENAIDNVAMQMINIIETDRARKQAEPHANARSGSTLPDSLVNDIALSLLENIPDIPDALLSLIQLRLDPKLANSALRASTDDERAKAALELATNPDISQHSLAKKIGVNQATISRWRRDKDFMGMVDSLTGLMRK